MFSLVASLSPLPPASAITTDAMAQVPDVSRRHEPLCTRSTDRACDQGDNANCKTAFHVPTDTHVQVACKRKSPEFTSTNR